jgi:hypothetical protein
MLGYLTLKMKELPLFGPSGTTAVTSQSHISEDVIFRQHFPYKIPVGGFHVTKIMLLCTKRFFFRCTVGRTEELVNHT